MVGSRVPRLPGAPACHVSYGQGRVDLTGLKCGLAGSGGPAVYQLGGGTAPSISARPSVANDRAVVAWKLTLPIRRLVVLVIYEPSSNKQSNPEGSMRYFFDVTDGTAFAFDFYG